MSEHCLVRNHYIGIRNELHLDKMPACCMIQCFNFDQLLYTHYKYTLTEKLYSTFQLQEDGVHDDGVSTTVKFKGLKIIISSTKIYLLILKLVGRNQDQDQDQDSLLVKRRNDNHSPGPVIRELVPSSHQRSELSNTILCIFSG